MSGVWEEDGRGGSGWSRWGKERRADDGRSVMGEEVVCSHSWKARDRPMNTRRDSLFHVSFLERQEALSLWLITAVAS